MFFFPYRIIRFLEIAPSVAGDLAGQDAPRGVDVEPVAPEADLELDEELLRRVREA